MFKFSKKIIIFLFIFTALFAVANFALAATDQFGMNYGRALGLADTDPRVAIVNLIRIALTFLGIIAVIIIMYGGYVWMTAAGEADKVDKAKKILISAIIGLIIILSAFLIASFVINKINEALGPQCNPTCGTGLKCCGNNLCIDQADTCCGDGSCGAGLKCCNSSTVDCRADCGGIAPTNTFYIQTKSPQPEGVINVIRNVKVRFTFNTGVSSTSVASNNFTVRDTSGNDILGTRVVRGRTIEFTPSGDCGNNICDAVNVCFASSTTVTVTANSGAGGIFSVNDIPLSCGGFNPGCTLTFTTGNTVDCQRPSIEFSSTWQTCVDTPNQIGFIASDDYGVSQVEISDTNGNRGFLNNPDLTAPYDPILTACPGPGNCGQLPATWNEPNAASWQPTVGSGYSTGTAYTINLNVFDLDNNERTVSRSYTLRDAHCCNTELDEDEGETGIDCGGDCAACDGAACGVNLNAACGVGTPPDNSNCDNSRCASGFCYCGTYPAGECQTKGYGAIGDSCCVCEARPFIDWVSPVGGFCDGSINIPCQTDAECSTFTPGTCNTDTPNGAVGNLFTISGRNFGTTTGHVWFVDANGNQIVEAGLANTANAACTAVWTNNQIIAVVPNGVGNDRRIRVVENSTGNNFSGDSPDTFLINTIERPGLCSLSPGHALRDAQITYQGIRLNGGTAYFGGVNNNVIGLNSDFLNPVSGTAEVPDIQSGRTTSFVLNTENINSNFLNFIKDIEAPRGPRITSFTPVSGTAGQYVTIMGQDFGSTKGTSKVFFGNAEASYDFPDVCADSVWRDNQVIVKVPAGLANGSYTINMNIGSWPQINTTQLSPNSFLADDTLPLLPSACKIFPVMGPNNAPVSMWGEYFGPQANALVRFQLNRDQSGTAITFSQENQADKAETTVPQDAITGPVRIVQDGQEGNGLNFRVGQCQSSSDCGGGSNICCPVGTYSEGRCAADIIDCYVNIPASVFEWDLNTGYGTSTPCYDGASAGSCDLTRANCDPGEHCDIANGCICVANAATCSGYTLNQCNNSYFCPNSPGTCSATSSPSVTRETGTCNQDCSNTPGCTPATCTYLNTLDRCVQTPNINCDLASTTHDRLGNDVEMYCATYNSQSRWHINTNLSCPDGWVSLIGGRCVSPNSCSLCSAGFSCLNNSGQGICGVNTELCSGTATCNNANRCTVTNTASCECCCEKGQDARDCCAPLVCDNTCGAGTVGSVDYGLCSGCANVGTTPAEHDAACNCSGSSGKFCDESVSGGVCRDCAQLGSTSDCNNHQTTCCVDPKNNDNCRGGNGSYTLGVCPFFRCEAVGLASACATTTPALGVYDSWNSCSNKCGGLPAGSSCFDTATENCSLTCDTGYNCLGGNGCNDGGCNPNDRSCLCCCDPNATPDTCASINLNANLVCRPNTEPCTSNLRGLCCGCKNDSECVPVGSQPELVGCSLDSCCRARPNPITSTAVPADGPALAENICRNAEISIEFDTQMDSGSFTGNVIVFGDYEGSPCPAGTVYLADAGYQPTQMNLFSKIYYKTRALIGKILSPILPRNIAQALMIPPGNSNYCAVTGSVGSFNEPDDHTRVSFSVAQAMEEDRLYYVLIKGDANLDSRNGVKSRWGLGMNGRDTATFNGITYTNAYIWSFRTLAGNDSICKIDSVQVDPASYLFKTNRNDANENDEVITDRTFDTVKDSDKVFIARPKSNSGQTLVPIPVYSWTWQWSSSNPTIADSVTGIFTNLNDANKTLVRANPNMTEGKTILTATAEITDLIVGGPLVYERGSANVYLFVCDNPWPPVDNNGEWRPWLDTPYNCSLNLGGCGNSNYELYYCRDNGGNGTYDDLPAIVSSSTIIRGYTENVFKEFYFFRESTPDSSVLQLFSTTNAVTDQGNRAAFYWADLITGEAIREYVIYYGRTPGNYPDFVNVPVTPVNTPHTLANPFIVDNLTNNVTYYFVLTAKNVSGAESARTDPPITFTPRDITPAGIPQNFSATSSDESVILNWTRVAGAASYIVSYGVHSPNFANNDNVGDVSRVEITGLTNGQTYYFAVNSVDNNGNISATSSVESAIPLP
jgi:hypothetical protein